MTDEEREVNKRRQHEYQCQYRARKKAELQNVSTTSVVTTQIMPESSLAGEKYLQLLHFLNYLIYILNHWAYVKVRVLELDYQLYWKMMIKNIPQIGYTEMIITCHDLETHIQSILVHCLLPVSQVSTTISCYFL
jgi:hypothetical protein